MKITKDAVVQFHYTLKNDEDEIIESSIGQQASALLHGHGGMISGVQTAMEGKRPVINLALPFNQPTVMANVSPTQFKAFLLNI